MPWKRDGAILIPRPGNIVNLHENVGKGPGTILNNHRIMRCVMLVGGKRPP